MWRLFGAMYFCGTGCPASASDANTCDKAAAAIIDFALANDIHKISVLGYTPKAGVEKNETDYLSEKLGACLAGRKIPALIERELLEKVLKEARLFSSAGTDWEGAGLNALLSVDAVVAGTVFSSGDRLKVLTKLIDMKTGRVLLASRSEAEREWPQLPEVPELDFGWGSGPAPSSPPPDLRDAVAEPGPASCADRRTRLAGRNAKLVDAKARYWANRMKEPGFSIRGLTGNPGSEISAPQVKSRFYEKLNAYYRSEGAAAPGAGELAKVKDLLAAEKQVRDECPAR